MKILKTLGLVVLAIVVLALIIGAILPTHFEFERSTDIDASKEAVFSTINDMKTWEQWGPWNKADTTMKMTWGEVTTGEGASYSWTSENSGDGKMTVTEVDAPNMQKAELEFDGEKGGTNWFKLEDGENGATKTTWGFEFDIPYPFNAMTLFTGGSMEKTMNEMFDSGLSGLKEMVESAASNVTYRGFTVNTEDFPGKSYLAIRETVSFSDMSSFFETKFGALMGAVGSKGLEMDGMPSGIYYSWDEENMQTDMAAAIPVKGGADAAAGNIQHIEIPKGKCLTIDYYGDYSGSGEAHYAMDDYIKANGVEANLVMEEYVTDPSTEPDTAKWLTKIHYFLAGPIASEE